MGRIGTDSLFNKEGSVLVLSVWVLAILFCLATSVCFRVRLTTELNRYGWDEIQLVQLVKMAAADGVIFAEAHGRPDDETFDNRSLPDGFYTSRTARGFGIEDENGRINLNQAPPETLQHLFGAAAQVVPAVVDWRSENGSRASGRRYDIRHAPFKSVEELRLVPGVTPDIFNDVKDFLTVDTDGSININTADPRVLQAVGLPPIVVNDIVRSRALHPLEQNDAINDLLKTSNLEDADRDRVADLLQSGLLTFHSTVMRMDITARLKDNRSSMHVRVVASGGKSGVHILQWTELRP